MGETPDPAEVAASEKEAAERKVFEDKTVAAKKAAAAKLDTVDLTETPSAAEDMISKANAAAARQEVANAELTKQVDRMEALKVEQTLGGKTEAGAPPQEDEDAGAKKILEGTGMEDIAFPPPEKKKD